MRKMPFCNILDYQLITKSKAFGFNSFNFYNFFNFLKNASGKALGFNSFNFYNFFNFPKNASGKAFGFNSFKFYNFFNFTKNASGKAFVFNFFKFYNFFNFPKKTYGRQRASQTRSWKLRPDDEWRMPMLMIEKQSTCPFAALQYPASALTPVTVPVFACTLPRA